VPDERAFLAQCGIDVESPKFPIPVQPAQDMPELMRVIQVPDLAVNLPSPVPAPSGGLLLLAAVKFEESNPDASMKYRLCLPAPCMHWYHLCMHVTRHVWHDANNSAVPRAMREW
jgi:hypothetical protein